MNQSPGLRIPLQGVKSAPVHHHPQALTACRNHGPQPTSVIPFVFC